MRIALEALSVANVPGTKECGPLSWRELSRRNLSGFTQESLIRFASARYEWVNYKRGFLNPMLALLSTVQGDLSKGGLLVLLLATL